MYNKMFLFEDCVLKFNVTFSYTMFAFVENLHRNQTSCTKI